MVWLITGLLLVLAGGLAVFARWGRRRPVADDTLVAELLGPPPARRVLPAPPVRQDAGPPAPAAEPAGEGGWLETQLAWITAWSQRMHDQTASTAAGPETGGNGETPPGEPARGGPGPQAAASLADARRLTDHGSAGPSRSGAAPRRCIATTAKGSQCKLPAEPGGIACAIHAKRAHP
jgi:hypothetical protein